MIRFTKVWKIKDFVWFFKKFVKPSLHIVLTLSNPYSVNPEYLRGSKVGWYLFIWCPNYSLKSYVFWSSSSLKSIFISAFCAPMLAPLDYKMTWNLKNPVHIDELDKNFEKFKFLHIVQKCCNGHFNKNVEFWDSLYHTFVKCSQGIILCKFWSKILIQLEIIANCDHCTTPITVLQIYCVLIQKSTIIFSI